MDDEPNEALLELLARVIVERRDGTEQPMGRENAYDYLLLLDHINTLVHPEDY